MKRTLIIMLCAVFLAISSFAKQYVVEMTDTDFKPANLQIGEGDTVTWIVKSSMQHTTTSGSGCKADGKWDSGVLNRGEKFTHVFKSAGSFPYYCIPHCMAGMTGQITVSAGKRAGKEEGKNESKEQGKQESKNDNSKENGNQGTDQHKNHDQGQNQEQNNTNTQPEVQPDQPKGDQHQHHKAETTTFRNTRIINAQSSENLKTGILEFRVVHRWDNITGDRGGPHSFFGLDNLRDERLSLEYGINDNFMVGLGRCKGDYTNAVAQQVRELYDLFVKYSLLKQNEEKKIPVSIALYANGVISTMKPNRVDNSEANFSNEGERWSFAFQPIIARKFSDRLSLEILPTYVRRNWAVNADEANLFSVGVGGSLRFTKRFGIVAEYFYNISEVGKNNPEKFYNPLAFGVEFNTGGHIFTINLSNATGILENTFIPYTTSSWLDDGFRLGFSIHRKFNLNRKK